jgi:hypothetical protein
MKAELESRHESARIKRSARPRTSPKRHHAVICTAARKLLTAQEIASLLDAPKICGDESLSDEPIIAWSAFLLWALLRGDL